MFRGIVVYVDAQNPDTAKDQQRKGCAPSRGWQPGAWKIPELTILRADDTTRTMNEIAVFALFAAPLVGFALLGSLSSGATIEAYEASSDWFRSHSLLL